MTTKGHLINNGGLRAHSVGEFFPFRIMAQGKPPNLYWYVIRPNGGLYNEPYHTAPEAHAAARVAFNLWSAGHAI